MELMIPKVSKALLSRARKVREDLHRHPELSFQEERTASVAADRLRELGLDEVREGVADTGVVGVLRGDGHGRTVALRADMDALPIQEETGLRYASENPGVMHACGHDGHVAVLLGVAEALAGARQSLAGDVKFIFQPGEEGYAGGKAMVQAGCLREPDVEAIFALHGTGQRLAGQVELSPTPYAAMMGFSLDVRGKGGHGAYPQLCVDPVAIGAHIVTAAQTIVSRESRPDRPAVLSFCAFQAGTKENVIPDTARLLGTIRALEMDELRKVRRSLGRVARNVAAAMRGEVDIQDMDSYPPVKNDPALLALVRAVAVALLGAKNVFDAEQQMMGAEDFAYYLPEQDGVPGAMFRIGVETTANHHTARFDFGSAALKPGILMLANVAATFLRDGPGGG